LREESDRAGRGFVSKQGPQAEGNGAAPGEREEDGEDDDFLSFGQSDFGVRSKELTGKKAASAPLPRGFRERVGAGPSPP
jgi:hypothetical protein